MYLRISWTDADELRNSPAEPWHVWEEETAIEETTAGGSDLDDFWELDEINRRRNFLAPSLATTDLDFLGSGKDIDGNVEARVSGVLTGCLN